MSMLSHHEQNAGGEGGFRRDGGDGGFQRRERAPREGGFERRERTPRL
jgi:hypothetical protein